MKGKELMVVERLPIKKPFYPPTKRKSPLVKRKKRFEKGILLNIYV